MNKKTLITVAIASLVGLGAIGAITFASDLTTGRSGKPFGAFMSHGHPGKGGFGMFAGQGLQNDPAHQALLAGNYDAFVAATKDTPFAKTLTPDIFTDMSAHIKQAQALQDAIINNDYNAYVTVVNNEYATKSSQDFFSNLVAKNKTDAAVKAAFGAKDYTLYVAAVKGTPQEGKLTEDQFTKMVNGKPMGMKGMKKMR